MTGTPNLFTTFNRLTKALACDRGYVLLSDHLGGDSAYGMDTPIDINVVLESNDLYDALWALQATNNDALAYKVLRLFAADCAESVLHSFERVHPDDPTPRELIATTRDCANGLTDTELSGIAGLAADTARLSAYLADASARVDSAAAMAAYLATDSAYMAARVAYWATNSAYLAAYLAASSASDSAYWATDSADKSDRSAARQKSLSDQIDILKGYLQ